MSTAVDRDQAFAVAVRRVAEDVAAPNAEDVDRSARFPREAIEALREERALSAFVPEELGGRGVSFETLADACADLGRACAAAAMVFAMHQIQIVTLVRHLDDAEWFESYLHDLLAEERLIASVTSELGTGGNIERSIAPVTVASDGSCTFEKHSPTVSYATHADDLLTTLRRGPEADASDQVLVLTTREQTQLEQTGSWDALGMRGTCSPGYVVRARFAPEQILPTPFARVCGESMVPVSHILWSHVWLGIASDAFDRARAFVRAEAKRTRGEPPAAGVRLSRLLSDLTLLRAEAESGLRTFVETSVDGDGSATIASALRYNNLKVAASEQAQRVCIGAMGVCGIVGYKNDTPFSVGRHIRDAMSGALMIGNERIHQTNAGLLLVAKDI